MSYSSLILFRVTALCVVSLQLFVLPATSVLHLGCAHAGCDHHGGAHTESTSAHPQAGSCVCRCGAHHVHGDARQSEDSEKSGHGHHDSHNCRICQTAFALITAESFAVCLQVHAVVGTIDAPTESAPDCPLEFDCPGRGPPA